MILAPHQHGVIVMIQNSKLREAQLYGLELLKTFDRICRQEGITYYLLGGTAIGAVRHQGFIPWDDDIDVGLMRDDYERFLAVAPKYLKANEIIKHFTLDKTYPDYTMKLSNSTIFYVLQKESTQVKRNVWIDIFPLDGAPGNKVLRWIHFRKIDFHRMLLAFKMVENVRIDPNRSKVKKCLIVFARYTNIGRIVDPVQQKKAIDKEFKKYPTDTSALIGNYFGAYHEVEFFPPDYFKEGRNVVFEDGIFTAPKELEKYLEHQYGNYMKLPPKEKRVPKHHVVDVIIETKDEK